MTDPNRTEYKVVPAPERARKVRGLKGAALFAHEIEALMNELASDGWVYVRAETLPQEERAGLTSKTTTYRNLLVFQRATLAVPVTAHARPTVKSPPTLPGPETDAAAAAAAAAAADDIVNLWQPVNETGEPTPDLPPDRQRQRMDL